MKSVCYILLSLLAHYNLLFVSAKRSRKLEATCTQSDYRFEFTDCDADGGRWRVAVPDVPGCENIVPTIPPKRTECFKSCEAGQFLNLTSLECEECQAGTFSLGGGIVFDEWDPLPNGFKIQVEKFRTMFSSIGRQYSNVNCSKWGWRTRKDMITSQGGPCVANLVYTAQLVKPGRLRFTYQYADDSVLFEFQANSDQCESIREAESSRWPALTGDGVWQTLEIPLHTGLNIFQWKTMGMEASRRPKPVMIRRIEIEGVGYTSSCNPCPGGTYNTKRASKVCLPCPKNTYSPHQSTRCIPCDTSMFYSEEGSDTCKERPACSKTDYYQEHAPCTENRTRIVYNWIEPEICLEDRPGAVSLPPPGDYMKCPPCNPGTEYREGNCKPCPSDEFSDGSIPCTKCPGNTQPNQNHHLTQWYSWPENLHRTCISPENSGCTNSPSWELHGNYTQSGRGHEKWVYLVMTLSIAGFRGVGRIINGELHEVGRVTFTFEMNCAHDCELLFMQGTSNKEATVVQRWTGSHAYEEFSQPIYRNDSYDFSWAFQKLAWDSATAQEDIMSNNILYQSEDPDDDNYVRIYQVQVKNTLDGGASACIPCPDRISLGRNIDVCLPCYNPGPNDRLVVKENDTEGSGRTSSDCLPCPQGQVRVDPFSSDSRSCRPCGPGLITKNGFDCVTDCVVQRGDLTYDLRPLRGFYTVRGSSLFTASGTQYYHAFNISVCNNASYATCEKNLSLQHGVDTPTRVEALVCQSTIFPPTVPAGSSVESVSGFDNDLALTPLSTHASSLGDHLVGISPMPSVLGIPIPPDIRNQLLNRSFHQLHFFYTTSERTVACPQGRSTTVTFRCKVDSSTWNWLMNTTVSAEKGGLRTVEGCSDGTCDGCNFHFLLESPYACHLCSESELNIVKGECSNGVQDIHYLPSPHSQCLPRIDPSWPTVQKCKSLPFVWQLVIQGAGGLALILALILICFWRRHRKLEYKYMKLVASGGSRGNHAVDSDKDGHVSDRDMMPVAESCALDPNEDSEEEDIYDRERPSSSVSRQLQEVRFHSDGTIRNFVSKVSIFDRLKSLTRKGEEGSNLEIMNLTDKEACS